MVPRVRVWGAVGWGWGRRSVFGNAVYDRASEMFYKKFSCRVTGSERPTIISYEGGASA